MYSRHICSIKLKGLRLAEHMEKMGLCLIIIIVQIFHETQLINSKFELIDGEDLESERLFRPLNYKPMLDHRAILLGSGNLSRKTQTKMKK